MEWNLFEDLGVEDDAVGGKCGHEDVSPMQISLGGVVFCGGGCSFDCSGGGDGSCNGSN